MTIRIRILRPASREREDLLPPRLEEFAKLGFQVRYADDLPQDPAWPYASASATARGNALNAALVEPDTTVILSARGGYGASDLLPMLDWARLKGSPEKLVVGFSDVSAIQSALYAQLGWRSLHGPMPATELWEKDGARGDIDALIDLIRATARHGPLIGSLPLSHVASHAPSVPHLRGPIFGGCFSVLSNLIGTPYFPTSLADHIVLVEDTDEPPARLMRQLNQWLQSGALTGVRALVVGHLRRLGDKIPDCAAFVLEEFARRSGVPTFHSPAFGHTSPNMPVGIGAAGEIINSELRWQLTSRPQPTV